MKIILCKGQFQGPISGADETLVGYATHLRRAGHSVSVLLIYSHSPEDHYYDRLRAAGVLVLYQELGMLYDPPDYRPFYEEFTSVLLLCAEVAALSPLLARKCREHLPHGGAISVLPILTEGLRGGRVPRRPRGEGVTVGFAARIEHLKGPVILLGAFAAACGKRRDLRLKFAGSGSLMQCLAERAAALGVASRCQFVGVYREMEERRSFMRGSTSSRCRP